MWRGFALERPIGVFDTLFLDSGSSQDQPGGTGKTFNWHEAASAVESLSRHQRIVIAGGLTPENVSQAMEILKPWGVDVASGVEARPGKKDPAEGAGVCESRARERSEGELEMATVPRTTNIKMPRPLAENARRTWHPARFCVARMNPAALASTAGAMFRKP